MDNWIAFLHCVHKFDFIKGRKAYNTLTTGFNPWDWEVKAAKKFWRDFWQTRFEEIKIVTKRSTVKRKNFLITIGETLKIKNRGIHK